MGNNLNKAISATDVEISNSVRRLMKKEGLNAFALAKHLSTTLNDSHNNVKAKLSSYLNNKVRWQNNYLTALTYIFGVDLNTLYGKSDKQKKDMSGIDKQHIIDTLVEEYRIHITSVINRVLT